MRLNTTNSCASAQSINLKVRQSMELGLRPHEPGAVHGSASAITTRTSGAGGGPSKVFIDEYIDALNTRDPVAAAVLYSDSGVHVNAARTVQGHEALLAWYNALFNQTIAHQSQDPHWNGLFGQWQLTPSDLLWPIGPMAVELNGNDTFG